MGLLYLLAYLLCLFILLRGQGRLWFQNFCEGSIRCIISCIDSGMFCTGIFEMPEGYIMVGHVVDRSLERA